MKFFRLTPITIRLCLLGTCLFIASTLFSQTASQLDQWVSSTTLLNDDFIYQDVNDLKNTGKWVTTNCNGSRKANHDPYYRDNNLTFTGSELIIHQKAEVGWGRKGNNQWNEDWLTTAPHPSQSELYQQYSYTSGRITSVKDYYYGKYEARVQVPSNVTTFPAFWIMGCNGPSDHEIDIFEFTHGLTDKPFFSYHDWSVSPAYNCSHQHSHSTNYAQHYHTYTVYWFPDRIYWLVDGNTVQTLGSDQPGFPREPGRIILNVDIESSWGGFAADHMKVNWVRHYPMLPDYNPDDLDIIWSNRTISPSITSPVEGVISGNFDGVGPDEVLEFGLNQTNDQVNLFQFKLTNASGTAPKTWDLLWDNGGNNDIGGWNTNQHDQFVVGNFTGGSEDEILCFSHSTQWAKVIQYKSSIPDWVQKWSNGGSGSIGSWNINSGDRMLVGDFDQDNLDEILCISNSTNWAKIMDFDGVQWNQIWSNGGNNQVGPWNMNGGDQFAVGDFDGNSTIELLCVGNGTLWSKVIFFDGGSWQQDWSNGGNGFLGNWTISAQTRIHAGNYNGMGQDEILCVDGSIGWSRLLQRDGPVWIQHWTNNGDPALNNWELSQQKFLQIGKFDDTKANVDLIYVVTNPTNYCNWQNYIDQSSFLLQTQGYSGKTDHLTNVSKSREEKPAITLIPNPSDGSFQVSSNTAIDHIEVLDLQGRRVHVERGNGAQQQLQLDLSAFGKGIYLIQTATPAGVDVQKAVIK